ncbi:universal stress protein [Pseudoalteromonas sp. L21]|uniref:universal stress protein n=1 Tax=Pseudoalteromonas sp. L21 TaxID=1539746 RepID=UPI001F3012B0|nr:universal stress protein [Pseudoalteromonas sp. L21]MCF7518605.1 universal stress protein [Pseudoalteromonas sp. L21]
MKKIFACIDGSCMTNAVTEAAIWIAKRTDYPVNFLHALEPPLPQGRDDLTAIIGLGSQTSLLKQLTKLEVERNKMASEHGKLLLEEAVKKAQHAGMTAVEHQQFSMSLVDALLDNEDDARVMIIGRSGKGHYDDFKVLGSHIETLIRQVHTPVAIVPPHFHEPTNFMFAYDGSEHTDKAITQIINGGILTGLDCHLVMVDKQDGQCQDKLDTASARLVEHGFNVRTRMLDGDVYEALWRYKSDHAVDLMVMGAFGHSKWRQFFLGSTTLKMLEDSRIPLVVLR